MNALVRDFSPFISVAQNGTRRLELAVGGVRCAGCISTLEKGVESLAGITQARLNFTERRLAVEWVGDSVEVAAILNRIESLGFRAYPFDPRRPESEEARESRRLLRCMAVAGFASANIMLLSVSVWWGNISDISTETRDLFHWISALIALPAAAFAGRPFYESALRGLRGGRINMDFPITLGVLLTLAMSVAETARSAHHAYFDGVVMLLFFLLIGRFLDQNMRRRTRSFAENLAALKRETAAKIWPDGAIRETPLSAVFPGDRVLVRPGERVAVDGEVVEGRSELDQSLVTGETALAPVGPASRIYAGALNASGALTVRVTAAASGTLLDEVNRLLSRALAAKSQYIRLADRATRLYAPLVHAAAGLTLVGWIIAGAGWQVGLLNAVAVLIITCPCALGLAIPAVQVVASGALFRNGLLLNSGDALERLAAVDTIVFDKTGTLTLPEPSLVEHETVDRGVMERAARLALSSRHPLASALATRAAGRSPWPGAVEQPGFGVSATVDGNEIRLGSARFCAAEAEAEAVSAKSPAASVLCYREAGTQPVAFLVRQAVREDAFDVIARARSAGYRVVVLSGDREAAVKSVAGLVGVDEWMSDLTPAEKVSRLEALRSGGRHVLMVGDGVNDAPALAAAEVSISPATAAHISQAAADAVFLGPRLGPVEAALVVGTRARRLMVQNLWFAALYNFAAVPLAAFGYLTPLIAALAMSGSSLIVMSNSLRAARKMSPVR